VGHCQLQALLTISSRLDSAPRYPLSFPFGAHPHRWRRGRCAVVMRAAADRLAPDAENELEKFGWCSTRGFIRRELIYNQIFNVMPLRCRHCRSDDFKIRFCESTPRQPEIRIRSEGGQKKQSLWREPEIRIRSEGEKKAKFVARCRFSRLSPPMATCLFDDRSPPVATCPFSLFFK
jgi:hypothetical protein